MNDTILRNKTGDPERDAQVESYFSGLKSKSKGGRKHLEDALQKQFISWFKVKHPNLRKLMFRIKNEGEGWSKVNEKTGKRYSVTGNKNKAMGTISGAGDLCLAINNSSFNSLYLELKKPGGSQSDEQIYWEMVVVAAGSKYILCDNYSELVKHTDDYIKTVSEYRLQKISTAMKEIEALEEIVAVKNFKKIMK